MNCIAKKCFESGILRKVRVRPDECYSTSCYMHSTVCKKVPVPVLASYATGTLPGRGVATNAEWLQGQPKEDGQERGN